MFIDSCETGMRPLLCILWLKLRKIYNALECHSICNKTFCRILNMADLCIFRLHSIALKFCALKSKMKIQSSVDAKNGRKRRKSITKPFMLEFWLCIYFSVLVYAYRSTSHKSPNITRPKTTSARCRPKCNSSMRLANSIDIITYTEQWKKMMMECSLVCDIDKVKH
jgi:hypothetical protein